VPSNKSKKTDIPKPSLDKKKVEKIEIPEGTVFSFRYYQDDKDKFSIRGRDARYWESLMRRLRDLSKLKVDEIINNRSKSIRFAPAIGG